jgi:hypothetical protein
VKEKYKMQPHNFKGRIIGYAYCQACGLIKLRNDFTQWAIAKGCKNSDHPDYAAARARFTGRP